MTIERAKSKTDPQFTKYLSSGTNPSRTEAQISRRARISTLGNLSLRFTKKCLRLSRSTFSSKKYLWSRSLAKRSATEWERMEDRVMEANP